MAFTPSLRLCFVGAIFLFVCVSLTHSNPMVRNKKCETDFGTPKTKVQPNKINQTIEVWQAVVLLFAFGAFALLIALIHKIVRTYIYYDAHLLDTFFDGGGDMNCGMIACSVVAKWAWTAPLTWASFQAKEFGMVGPFWYACGASAQIFLFSIIAAEIRIKAPGAKTYLQVIYARFGALPHIIVMGFAIMVNVFVSGIVLNEGIIMLDSITKGLDEIVFAVIIALVVGFYTVVGGVGGSMYVAYFACAIMMSVVLVVFTEIFYDPLAQGNTPWGNVSDVFEFMDCAKCSHVEEESCVSIESHDAMMKGIVVFFSSFSAVFVDQSFWQSAIAGKPLHSVLGFLTGGLVWFALPFCGATAFGVAYWGYSIDLGVDVFNNTAAATGLMPVYLSQQILGKTGDYLMFIFVMVAIITTASAQVLSASSIIVYDIYQTYVSPFNPTPIPEEKQMSIRMQKAIKNEEYLEYDRRCVVLKHVVVVAVTCLLFVTVLVLQQCEIDMYWLFMLMAVCTSSCVMPIILAITWHRMTRAGVVVGSVGGFVAALVVWLVYASDLAGGLGMVDDASPSGIEHPFRYNTLEHTVALAACVCALGTGGLLCILVSLPCGGCDSDLMEEEEWEKTRLVDNPIVPWSVKYAPDIGAAQMTKGKPHFYTVRRTFMFPELCAYIFGVLLAVLIMLVWPACMLTAKIWDSHTFKIWILVILIWTAVTAGYIILLPFTVEIIQVCKQAFYNRMWARSEPHERLAEEMPTPETTLRKPPHHKNHDQTSYRSESDFHSTMGREPVQGTL